MRQPIHTGCVFCGNLAAGSAAQWDRVLTETDNYVIVPSKGALVPGWVLVVSKHHFLCAGALPAGRFAELQVAVDTAANIVSKRFGPVTIFEHGPQRPGTSLGCGIDHLHVHVVPLRFSLTAAVESFIPGTKWEALGEISDLRDIHGRGLPYGMVQERAGHLLWCRPPVGTRQMFRQVVAREIGIPEQFDYAAYPHLGNVIQTIERFQLDA